MTFPKRLFIVMIAWLPLAATPPTTAQIQIVGACRFEHAALKFEGSPVEQARCLLRPVGRYGVIGPTLERLPPALGRLVGRPSDENARQAFRAYLLRRGVPEANVGGSLDHPVSRARDNDATAPFARYFVIHDTSWPYIGDADFPADLDADARINNLAVYKRASVAHVFSNRRLISSPGSVYVGHDFSEPWRATKLESRTGGIGPASKGLFLHIENAQPRRRDPQRAPNNNFIAPEPGFSTAQYEKLALFYVAASVRAGRWMIPAYHAVLDYGFIDAHDDPQHFSLDAFDAALADLMRFIAPHS